MPDTNQSAAPETIYLRDYTAFGWTVTSVHLTFDLVPNATRVTSKIAFAPNPDATSQPFTLMGEDLTLISARIDGVAVSPILHAGGLTVDVPDAPFIWEAEVEIDPASNTALEGLYMSNGMYCTQCEAEGFRKITYYPDRPDVMAPFTVRVNSDLPVLLSNGNPVAQGDGFAEWDDPWPKPSYLFALVAGDLVAHSDRITTMSGRDVALNIWVRPGDEDKCAYAMDALKRSMIWDEQVYGREYDLDVFNIVAVDDFNMGAMENKGLNIFNSKFVLASAETATDADFARIESIIAHEYFHNWTGNRITCRDWFQLCLKEGLTVYRDQQFSGDMRSHAVQRIEDVLMLRARQFREDNGPLAHPVRPDHYVEINNFYTATVYEKGAEVIGMLRTLVGEDGYRDALNLYFDRHDGDASTIEDWLQVFEDATGRDLGQFKRWYTQSGTPRLTLNERFNDGTYEIDIKQEVPETKNQSDPQPLHIPVAIGLLSPNGDEVVPTQVLELTEAQQTFRFDGLGAAPVASVLRNFSAPVIVNRAGGADQNAFLLAHDTDPFNKWEAGRALSKSVLLGLLNGDDAGVAGYVDAMAQVITDDKLDPAFRALTLGLPSEDDLAQSVFDGGCTPDPMAIHDALGTLRGAMAAGLETPLRAIYAEMHTPGAYSPDAGPAGRRALRGAALGLLSRIDGGALARAHYDGADNMTDSLAALSALLRIGQGQDQIDAFYAKWADDRLVLDKWFMMQVALAPPETAAAIAENLSQHPAFDWKNPNRFRSLIGGLTSNAAGFHAPDGAGYRFVAEWLMRLDPKNPQTAARMSTAFETWRRYDADRQDLIREQLNRIAAMTPISRDMGEMVGRMLNA